VHYLAGDRLDEAQRWLRLAADSDIGDAALRLAYLYELKAVTADNSAVPGDGTDEQVRHDQREAARWFARARAAGYTAGDADAPATLELPFAAVPCCAELTDAAARERADRVVAEAEAAAAQILRAAGADRRRIIRDAGGEAAHQARAEIDDLLRERDRLTEEVVQLGAAVRQLAGQLPTVHTDHPAKRHPTIGRPGRWRDKVGRRLRHGADVTYYWSAEVSAQQRTADPERVWSVLEQFPAARGATVEPSPDPAHHDADGSDQPSTWRLQDRMSGTE
jgi:hypothetical protein